MNRVGHLVAMVQAQKRVVRAQTLEPSCNGPDSENSLTAQTLEQNVTGVL